MQIALGVLWGALRDLNRWQVANKQIDIKEIWCNLRKICEINCSCEPWKNHVSNDKLQKKKKKLTSV